MRPDLTLALATNDFADAAAKQRDMIRLLDAWQHDPKSGKSKADFEKRKGEFRAGLDAKLAEYEAAAKAK